MQAAEVSLATAHLVGISLDDAKIDASVFPETDALHLLAAPFGG